MKIAFSAMGIRYGNYKWSWTPDNPAPNNVTKKLLSWAKDAGYDGFELEDHWIDFYNMSDSEIKQYKSVLDSTGMPIACIKTPGKNLCHPDVKDGNKKKLVRAIEIASMLESTIISLNLASSNTLYNAPITNMGGISESWGSSKDASEKEFELTADCLREAAKKASYLGVSLAIEVHQHAICDSAKSTIKLLDMVGEKNVGANPDLGNIYWTYQIPEEDWAESINKLADRTLWWHCKNLNRVHIPDLNRSIFIKTTLDQGDIDYRYCVNTLHQAGYEGYILVEGTGDKDGLYNSKRNLNYLRDLLSDLD